MREGRSSNRWRRTSLCVEEITRVPSSRSVTEPDTERGWARPSASEPATEIVMPPAGGAEAEPLSGEKEMLRPERRRAEI